jgi:hypothetical protein
MKYVRYITGYECSKSLVETFYHGEADRMTYGISAPSREIDCHILLLPGRAQCEEVTPNGARVDYRLSTINRSVYVDFSYRREGAPGPRVTWPRQVPDVIRIVLGSP